jgi:hypothetical protein
MPIWGLRKKSPFGNIFSFIWGLPFPYGDPHVETGRQTKKFPFGESPFQNRVCSHLGINIYLLPTLDNTNLYLSTISRQNVKTFKSEKKELPLEPHT